MPVGETAFSVEHSYPVTVYYEDTDFTGYVYHANYLRYFERAREEMLGVDHLVALYRETGVGFVVYKAELTYREPARHGDRLEILSRGRAESAYRAVFEHTVRRRGAAQVLVSGVVQMVAVDRGGKLVALPDSLPGWIARGGAS